MTFRIGGMLQPPNALMRIGKFVTTGHRSTKKGSPRFFPDRIAFCGNYPRDYSGTRRPSIPQFVFFPHPEGHSGFIGSPHAVCPKQGHS